MPTTNWWQNVFDRTEKDDKNEEKKKNPHQRQQKKTLKQFIFSTELQNATKKNERKITISIII